VSVSAARLAIATALLAFVAPAVSGRAFARDVVFILGEDLPGKAALFAPAEAYYRAKDGAAATLLVTGARSLQDVREILQFNGEGRWNSVTLVMHGSPWEGAEVGLYADGERAVLEAVRRAAQSGAFPPVSDDRIDAFTVLHLESCGLGRRPDYLDALARLFGGDDGQRPRVVASSHFVAFARTGGEFEAGVHHRFELPMISRVLPVAIERLDAARLERQAAAMRRALGDAWPGAEIAPRLKPSPIRVQADVAAVRIAGRSPAQLAAVDAGVRGTLRAYGLDHRALHWRWDGNGASPESRALVGEGTLVLMHANPAWALAAISASR